MALRQVRSTREEGIAAMKMFTIEAYGGPMTTDGPIAHFTVHAGTVPEAVDLIRRSADGHRFGRFEVVEESAEFEGDVAEIIGVGTGSYEKTL
jgi:hypothetical protein